MREDAKGRTLIEQDLVVSAELVAAFGDVLATGSAADTATLVPFFGAVVGGQATAVDGLGLDLARALLAGIDYTWERPFTVGETVRATVVVEDVHQRKANQFGVLAVEFTDSEGALVQRQTVTFIERGAA